MQRAIIVVILLSVQGGASAKTDGAKKDETESELTRALRNELACKVVPSPAAPGLIYTTPCELSYKGLKLKIDDRRALTSPIRVMSLGRFEQVWTLEHRCVVLVLDGASSVLRNDGTFAELAPAHTDTRDPAEMRKHLERLDRQRKSCRQDF